MLYPRDMEGLYCIFVMYNVLFHGHLVVQGVKRGGGGEHGGFFLACAEAGVGVDLLRLV